MTFPGLHGALGSSSAPLPTLGPQAASRMNANRTADARVMVPSDGAQHRTGCSARASTVSARPCTKALTHAGLTGANREVAYRDDLLGIEISQEAAARADPAVECEQVPDVERPPRMIGLARRGPRYGLEIAEVGRPRRRRGHELLVLVAGLDERDRRGRVARGHGAAPG